MIRKCISCLFTKQKPIDAFKGFLQHDIGASVRRQQHHKDRKYVNVEIKQKFKEDEQKRKSYRLEQINQRKKILQQKLNTQSKLLTSGQSTQIAKIKEELSSLQLILQEQKEQLQKIEKNLEESEADLILVEGYKKLGVLNQIEYLKHMNYHNTGLVLHPQTIKIIENVHYLVNNNLPVNKYKLFEIMPDIFKKQINQLQLSMQKLIQEKQLDPDSDPSSRIRFFVKHKTRFHHPQQQIIDLQLQRDAVYSNMQDEIDQLIKPHIQYIKAVQRGQTPFRSAMHMVYVFLSTNFNLKLSQEEQALKDALVKAVQLKDKFAIYSDEIDNKRVAIRYRYIQPPIWVQNHPVLLKKYQEVMLKFTNPVQVTSTLQIAQSNEDDGQAYLRQRLYKLSAEKYNPLFEQLWNAGKKEELISMKKKFQIDFYNDSAKILEEYQEMVLENKQKEEFLKIPKVNRQLIVNKYTQLSLDQLTKAIFVNNTDPKKYNPSFFANFFGIQNEQQVIKLFNSFSYLRVKDNQANNNAQKAQKIQFQILKFKIV